MSANVSLESLQFLSEKIRRRLVEVVYMAKAGHIGGGLSSLNVLTVLYFKVMNVDPQQPQKKDRDRFVMSKGHCAEALYSVLEARGFIPTDMLNTYGQYDSPLAGHPTVKNPGVEVNSGALGHGLSIGVGMSIAAKMDNMDYKTYVLMGDGEQGEGSIYEAAMSASHYKLDNLVAIIDRNRLQISGKTEDVMCLEPMRQRWEAFGWEVFELNGNDIDALLTVFDEMSFDNQKPKLIIANTIKGNGISYMENIAKWHHGVPSEEQYDSAMQEIGDRIATISPENQNK